MREFCLISPSGSVITMCMSYKPEPPELTEYQRGKGFVWVPVGRVPQSTLERYRYWSERP